MQFQSDSTGIDDTSLTLKNQKNPDLLRVQQWCNTLLQNSGGAVGGETWTHSSWSRLVSTTRGSSNYGPEDGLKLQQKFQIAVNEIKDFNASSDRNDPSKIKHDPESDMALHNLVDPPPKGHDATPFIHALPYLALAYTHLGPLFEDDATYLLERYIIEIYSFFVI